MCASLLEYWDWNPALVAAVCLVDKKIDYLLIGSAAIHYHKLDTGMIPTYASPPWYFANIFELCVPDDKIEAAAKCLLRTPLFEPLNPETYDTMYEGTGGLIKLRAKWIEPSRVKFILLPKSQYFAPPFPERPENMKPPAPPFSQVGNPFETRLQALRIPSKRDLLLSFAHRVLIHKDQHVRRSIIRLRLKVTLIEPITLPSEWDDEARTAASELLEKVDVPKPGDGKPPLQGGDLSSSASAVGDPQQGLLPSPEKRKRPETKADENKKVKTDVRKTVPSVPRSESSGPA